MYEYSLTYWLQNFKYDRCNMFAIEGKVSCKIHNKDVYLSDCQECLKARLKRYNKMIRLIKETADHTVKMREHSYAHFDLRYDYAIKIPQIRSKINIKDNNFKDLDFYIQIYTQTEYNLLTVVSAKNNFDYALEINPEKAIRLLLTGKYDSLDDDILNELYDNIVY